MGNIEKFDIIAEQYDTPQRLEIASITADAIKERIADGRNKSAIDYGCGTGLVGMSLLDAFNSVMFIDASEKMIAQVKHKLAASKSKNAEVCCCDFMKEIPHGLQADTILLVQVLLHEKNIEQLLSRLYNVVNRGGSLIIVDFDKNVNVVSDKVHSGFEQKELANIMRENSFIDINSATFFHGKSIFMNQDASLFLMQAFKKA